jgi:hypothetical protein
MNCLLMREISVKNTIRMWDTYLVGHRPPDVLLSKLTRHRPRSKASPSSTYTFARRSWSSGPTSYSPWTSRRS